MKYTFDDFRRDMACSAWPTWLMGISSWIRRKPEDHEFFREIKKHHQTMLAQIKAIGAALTPAEKEDPESITDPRRLTEIAAASGHRKDDVREILRMFSFHSRHGTHEPWERFATPLLPVLFVVTVLAPFALLALLLWWLIRWLWVAGATVG